MILSPVRAAERRRCLLVRRAATVVHWRVQKARFVRTLPTNRRPHSSQSKYAIGVAVVPVRTLSRRPTAHADLHPASSHSAMPERLAVILRQTTQGAVLRMRESHRWAEPHMSRHSDEQNR